MSKEIKKLWGSGLLNIGGAEIDAYVLEDGTALIGKTKVLKALGRPKKGDTNPNRPEFIAANNLQPFVTIELEDKLKGIEFLDGKRIASAYSADMLALICNVYLEARQAGVLTTSQLPIAQQCEILIRSFSKVGLIALIYEQLGFEKFKHPEAFRILIESYLSEEERKWSKEFPDELFIQMDRIYGNEKTTSRNRPQYYAKFIRKYIYEPIEKGEVLLRLDQVNPSTPTSKDPKKKTRKVRHHTHTSLEIGLPAVKAQIWQVIGALKVSSNKRKFESNFAKLMGKSYQGDIFED